jgi:hypothetical protein
MVQYLENALKYNRVSEWKSGSEKLRMFFDGRFEVQSRKRAEIPKSRHVALIPILPICD